MTPTANQTRKTRRSGVALVITLGLLSMLLLIAFAFAVSMQVERTAGVAHADSVMARQGLYEALSLAAQTIVSTNFTRTALTYPGWNAYQPRGELHGRTVSLPTDYRLYIRGLAATVSNYVPASILPDVVAAATNLSWANLFTAGTQLTGSNIVSGVPEKLITVIQLNMEDMVVGTLLVNCSGFLDANVVGRTNRAYGTNPQEIQVNLLDDYTAAIKNKLGPDDPAESYPELTARVSRYPSGLSNYFHYSHYPVGQYYDPASGLVRDQIFVGITELDLPIAKGSPKWNDYYSAFQRSGFTSSAHIERLVRNLLDYVDDNNTPQTTADLLEASQEPVPGVNEIAVKSIYECERSADGSNCVFYITVEFNVEVWNPYITPTNSQRYTISCSQPGNAIKFTPTPGKMPPGIPNAGVNLMQNFTLGPRQLWSGKAVLPRGTSSTVPFSDFNNYKKIEYTMECFRNIDIRQGSGALVTLIDQVPCGATLRWNLSAEIAAVPEKGQTVTNTTDNQWAMDLECLDPRFNWDPPNEPANQTAENDHWRRRSETNTLGKVNSWTASYATDPANGVDGDLCAYTANQPLRLVGELGYLVYEPWRTVRLYRRTTADPVHRVLDVFTLTKTNPPAMTYPSVKGLVNPNTSVPAVMEAVFTQMPLDDYPTDDAAKAPSHLTRDQAALVAKCFNEYLYGGLGSPPFFMNLSDVGSCTNVFSKAVTETGTFVPGYGMVALNATNEFQREAILRNSAGLLSTRSQVFTLFVAASHVPGTSASLYNPDADNPRSSEKRAVAVFWRDTWTGESFMRFFKVLDE